MNRMTRLERIQEERRALQHAVKERLSTALTGAFGLVAALAWNDAVRAAIDYFYPPSKGSDLGPKFLYAVIITLVVSIAFYVITKFFADKEKK